MIILVILWTCVGVFIATSIVTLLGLLGIVDLPKKYMNALFTALIIEVVAVGVGIFSGTIDPTYMVGRARDTGEREAYLKIQNEIMKITNRVSKNIQNEEFDAATDDLRMIFYDILGNKISAVSDVFYLKGLIAERRELWATASSNYETALQIKPDNPDILVRAARTKIKLKDYEEAGALYDSAQIIARNLGNRYLEYSIANGRQNVERRFGAFLLEVGRLNTSDKHFQNALRIIRSMEAIRPETEDGTTEKVARYRVFWEWQKYDEALSEIKALMKSYSELTYIEDYTAILIDTKSMENIKKAYQILTNLEKNQFVVASLAEVASVVESDLDIKNIILDELNQVIVADDPDNRDPYLYYVKAILLKSNNQNEKALNAISEAIRLERARSANLYIFDPIRFERYKDIKNAWEASLLSQSHNIKNQLPSSIGG